MRGIALVIDDKQFIFLSYRHRQGVDAIALVGEVDGFSSITHIACQLTAQLELGIGPRPLCATGHGQKEGQKDSKVSHIAPILYLYYCVSSDIDLSLSQYHVHQRLHVGSGYVAIRVHIGCGFVNVFVFVTEQDVIERRHVGYRYATVIVHIAT